MSFRGDLLKAGIVPTFNNNVEIQGVLSADNFPATQGNSFYVHATDGTDAAGQGTRPSQPLASIDYAIGLCTANQGDKIYVLPGHAETISGATSLVADIAGIEIIGLGHGADTPTLTFTAAASTISITAASVKMSNFRLLSNFTNGVAAGITLGAGADSAILENIYMTETANTKEWLIGISIAAGCNDVDINGLRYYGLAGGSTTQVIKFAGASNYSRVRNFLIFCDASGAAIDALTAASVWMDIGPGVLHNLDTAAGLSVSVKSDTTGFMHDMRISQLKNGVFPAGAAMAISEVYISNVIFTQGFYGIVQDS